MLKEIDKELYYFLGVAKPTKLKKNIVIQDYRLGGLKMIDYSDFTHALKSSWIRRLLISKSKWVDLLEAQMKIKINNLWIKGSDYVLKHSKSIGNKFWSEVFLSYLKLAR